MSFDAEFGIINRFDYDIDYRDYENRDSILVCIEDKALDFWSDDFYHVKTYHYSYDRPATGLLRKGITLIPPKSLRSFLDIVLSDNREEYKYELLALKDLIIDGIERNKFMIHYGEVKEMR